MRIGIVTGEYPPLQGGVGAYTRILARTLADQGQTIFVLTSARAVEPDSRITLSPIIEQWGVGSLSAVSRWAVQNRLDLINLQYQTAAYGMSPWVHFIPDAVRCAPVVTTFHDLRFPYLFPKAGWLRDWIVMHLARASDGVIATNHEDLQRLQHLPNAALIPIGSNILQPLPEDFDPHVWRERADAGEGDFLLAFFGLVNRSKGLDLVIEALARLRAEGCPARLVIIGGEAGSSDPTNTTYQQEIQKQIERLNLRDFVHTTGFVDEAAVASYLAASDVVVLPFRDGASYRRGSLMAALQFGCAIVTTQPNVATPAFVDGDNMLLVPPDDVPSLTNAVQRLYDSAALRSHLSINAKRLAAQFEWAQIARDTISLFARVSGVPD
jgi:glycosyltransferase involved in cell wall biosynthesis